jgi:hypothetical protein
MSKVHSHERKIASLIKTKSKLLSVLILCVLVLEGLSAAPFSIHSDTAYSQSAQSCFVSLPSGSTVENQTAQETIAILPSGAEVTYSTSNGNCASGTGYSLSLNGYIEYFSNTVPTTQYYLSDTQYVPQPPSDYVFPSVVALFDGIESDYYIWQPVLVYGCQFVDIVCLQGGTFWWISAEQCSNSSCAYTSAIQVNPNDVILGTAEYTTGQCYRNLNAPQYLIIVKDATTNKQASLRGCAAPGETALPAAYEVHGPLGGGLISCDQLPNQRLTVFSNILSDSSFWTAYLTSGLSPNCGFQTPYIGSNYDTLYLNT